MDIHPELIDAEVHYSDPEKSFYYVKIIFLGTGLYINSFSVKPSKRDGELWVERPKFKVGGFKYMSHVDFDKSLELWKIVEKKALKAVADYKAVHEAPYPSDSNDDNDKSPFPSDDAEYEYWRKKYGNSQ